MTCAAYQDSVSAPVDHSFDDSAVGLDDDECDVIQNANAQEGLENVLSAITKVSHV